MKKLLLIVLTLALSCTFSATALAATIDCNLSGDNGYCYGTNSADTITGTRDDDTIYGRDGADSIFGDWGRDDLRGGEGQDDIDDHDQYIDYIFGGKGNDNINVVDDPDGGTVLNPYGDTVECGDGDADRVVYDAGVDRIHGDCERKVPNTGGVQI